jgi:SAM-dependent methyltransferase
MLNSKYPSSHLVKLVQPGSEWRILVTAGDNISVALAFAPHVNHVTLVCPTARQVQDVEEAAARACLGNIVCDIHDPECLPYADDSFDLLVCHHTAHTLHDADAWLLEAARILQPQGLMVVETYLVPGTRLRGKKARKLREVDHYLNAFYQLRNPKHQSYYSQNGWEDQLMGSGFDVQRLETADKIFDFAQWADEAALASKDRLRLKVMLVQAPEKAREFLTTQFSGDRIQFRLPEITILAKSKASPN